MLTDYTTGHPSSKYEHRRASALLRNIRNVRICMGKETIVSVTYENKRISIKNCLPCIKCVLRLSCVVHGPIYGRFIKRFFLYIYRILVYKSLYFECDGTMPMLIFRAWATCDYTNSNHK